jgi:hypothetical protein
VGPEAVNEIANTADVSGMLRAAAAAGYVGLLVAAIVHHHVPSANPHTGQLAASDNRTQCLSDSPQQPAIDAATGRQRTGRSKRDDGTDGLTSASVRWLG